jgi:hypothetical protein
MLNFKKFIQNSFLFLTLFSLVNNLEANKPIKKLTTQNVVGGVALALAAHTALEFISTGLHELGHAGANKMMNPQDPINIEVTFNNNILQPYKGRANFASPAKNKTSEAIRIASGPIAGISATMAQIVLFKILENHINKKPLITKNSLNPFRFFKDSFKNSKALTTSLLKDENNENNESYSTLEIALEILKFLRTGRIVGETLYGFTPISIPEGVGDGQHVWKLLLNKEDGYPTVSNNLISITLAIMSTPLVFGISKGIIKSLKNKQSSE